MELRNVGRTISAADEAQGDGEGKGAESCGKKFQTINRIIYHGLYTEVISRNKFHKLKIRNTAHNFMC